MNESITTFGLTFQQMRILFSLEYYIAKQDAEGTERILDILNPFSGDHSNKELWVKEYDKKICGFMNNDSSSDDTSDCSLFYTSRELQMAILNESDNTDRGIWKYLIMLECILFTPYYPLSEVETEKKKYKGLSLDEGIKEASVNTIASWLGVTPKEVKLLKETYESGVKKMTGYWNKIFLGIGAGVVAGLLAVVTCGGSIAALFAASGLYGAAAVSSGLAALGGGAIAAGGFGMVGGMAVLIGGGVLLGTGAGASVSIAIAETNPSGVMNECAKMYVVLKEIVLGIQHDTMQAQQIISGILDKMATLNKDIVDLKIQSENNKAKIKILEKNIESLEKNLDKIEESKRLKKQNEELEKQNKEYKKKIKNLEESIEYLKKLIDLYKSGMIK